MLSNKNAVFQAYLKLTVTTTTMDTETIYRNLQILFFNEKLKTKLTQTSNKSS